MTIRDLPWVDPAERAFRVWLETEAGEHWTPETLTRPGIGRWTVSWIVYEGIWHWRWNEPLFRDGARAFGLLALEREGAITLTGSPDETQVRLRDGTELSLEDFLAGESVPFRHDPEYADLDWSPVPAMAHLLSELGES